MLNIVIGFLIICLSSCVVYGYFKPNRLVASKTILYNKTPLTANGKRFEAEPGSSMIAACTKLGLRVPTKCKKGDCGTCTVTCAGNKIRACVGKVPPAPKLKSLIEKGLPVSVDNA
jgi:hypothetical protein